LDIPPEQQKIKAGQSLLLEVVIRVPGGNIDQTSIVELEYSIRDLDGNLISSKEESGAIAVKESNVISLLIPTNTMPGIYRAFVIVDYEGDLYEGSKTFEVIDNKSALNLAVYILAILILIVILLIVFKKLKSKSSSRLIRRIFSK